MQYEVIVLPKGLERRLATAHVFVLSPISCLIQQLVDSAVC